MTTLIFLYTHRKAILAAFLVLLFFVLWFAIERQSDRIDALRAEIETKNSEIAVLRSEIAEATAEVGQVKAYLEKLKTISAEERQELTKNEKICENVTDFDSIIPRINELFGYCSDTPGN